MRMDARLGGHKYEFSSTNESNALAHHWSKAGHEPDFGDANVLMQFRDAPRASSRRVFIASGSNLKIIRSSHRVAALLVNIINQIPGRP